MKTRNPIVPLATTKNNRFNKNNNPYVSLINRYASQIIGTNHSTIITALAFLRARCKKDSALLPNEFSNMSLCKAFDISMDSIVIDTTLQRNIDVKHLATIIRNFDPKKVTSLKVWEDKSAPNKYILWDGQHTGMAEFLIAQEIYGCNTLEDFENIYVPAQVSDFIDSAETRKCFVHENGSGKKKLTAFDMWEQSVFSVRIDGNTDKNHVEIEKKQTIFANHGMHVANPDNPRELVSAGGIGRLQEINHTSVSVSEQFATYFEQITFGSPRHCQSNEVRIMYWFFKQCEDDKIKVSDPMINEIVRMNDALFGGDFDGKATQTSKGKKVRSTHGTFYLKVKTAYEKWYSDLKKSNPKLPRKRFEDDLKTGVPFLLAQYRKNMQGNYTLPTHDATVWPFEPDPKDLF